MVDPIYLLLGGCSFCAFMLGYNWSRMREATIIERCLEYLIKERYVRSFTNSKGETELKKIHEK